MKSVLLVCSILSWSVLTTIEGQESRLYHQDFDWNDFVEKLFQHPPRDPLTFRMSFLDQLEEGQLDQLLGIMLVNGARNKFHKELADLLADEIDVMQKYLRSIGYEFKYQVEECEQFVGEYNKVMPVNYHRIHFIKLLNDIRWR